MRNKETLNSASTGNSAKTGWESVAAIANGERHRSPEYEVNGDGDVKFSRIGDEIVFGETEYTRRVDVTPRENREDYDSSVVAIQTFDGNRYYISEGLLIDKNNDKKVDLLMKRYEDANFSFPKILIGYKLPYEKISENLKVPEGEGGTVVSVISYGEASATQGEGSQRKKQIQGDIHEMILKNDAAKNIRGIRQN